MSFLGPLIYLYPKPSSPIPDTLYKVPRPSISFLLDKYNSKNYDSLRIVVKKGKKAIISQYAQEQGKSINGLVNELLEEKIPQLKVLKENRTE